MFFWEITAFAAPFEISERLSAKNTQTSTYNLPANTAADQLMKLSCEGELVPIARDPSLAIEAPESVVWKTPGDVGVD